MMTSKAIKIEDLIKSKMIEVNIGRILEIILIRIIKMKRIKSIRMMRIQYLTYEHKNK